MSPEAASDEIPASWRGKTELRPVVPKQQTGVGKARAALPITREALSARTPVLGRRAQLASVSLRIIVAGLLSGVAGLLSWIGAIHVHLWGTRPLVGEESRSGLERRMR